MPNPPDHTIDLSDSNATEYDTSAGTTIAWHNSTTSDITLNPPTCVSPSGSTDIPAGQTSRNFTVNAGNGLFTYSFTVGAELGTRNGSIRVNN